MLFDSLSRMQWRRSRYTRRTTEHIKQLRHDGKHKEASDLTRKMDLELHLWHEAILAHKTRKLRAKAERLDVPLPWGEDVWRTSEEGDMYLPLEVQAQLRKEIRQEQKERRDMRITWVKDVAVPVGSIIIAILGLIVALTHSH